MTCTLIKQTVAIYRFRPGLSFIAGALAVELMVAVLHSPLGTRHPAPKIHHINPMKKEKMKGDGDDHSRKEKGKERVEKEEEEEEEEGELALIPHQLRGSLATFTQIAPMVS